MTSLSNAGIAQRMSDMVALWDTREREFREWTAGTPEGGPYGDGRYPLSSSTGTVYYIPCPAALAREVTDPAAKAVLLAAQAEAAKIAAATSAVRAEEAQAQALAQRNQASTERASAETARLGAQAHEANAQVYRDQALAARDAAAATAVQVQEGLDATTAAVDSVIADATAAGAAQVALAETARNAAQTARTGAETARTGAETAKTAAETARTDAQTAASQAAASAASVVPSNLMHISGNETATGIKSFNQQININALAGANAHLYLRDEAGIPQGLLYWDRAGDRIRLRRYNEDSTAAEGELTLTATDLLWNGQPALLGTVTNAADNTVLPSTYTPFIATGSMVAGAPTGGAATHLTWRSNSDNRSAQIVTSNAGGTGNPDIWFRTHHTSDNGGGWTAFAKLWHNRASRLQADFSNSTNSLRTLFQTNTANANTVLGVLPNGTATISALNLYAGSNADNAPILQIRADATQAVFLLNKTGTATAQTRFSFQDNTGAEKVGIDNTGLMTFGTTGQIKFANQIRQHITLWETSTTPGSESSYGIGVQNSSWYARSDAGFAFFQKGTHHADKFNPGSNGKMLVQFDADSNGNAAVGIGGAHGGVSTAVQAHRGALGTQQGFYSMAQGGNRIWQIGMDSDRSFRLWSYTDAGAFQQTGLSIDRTAQIGISSAGIFAHLGWFRSQQWGTGWYHELGGGGWYMSDTTWIRNYNNKPLLLQCSGGTVARYESPSPTFEFYDTDEGYTSWLHLNGGSHGFLQHNNFAWGCYRDSGNSWIVTGNIAAYASDARLKKNPTPLRQSVLDRFFDNFPIIEFDWDLEAIERLNPGFSPNAIHEVGSYAQSVEKVFKSMVVTRKSNIIDGVEHEGIKTLLWEKAVPFTVAGVQQLREENKQLKAQIASILARLEQLENAA